MMPRILQMAWRNLWRTPRRTLVTLLAMTLALLVMILYTSLMEGFLRDIERDIVEVEMGDLQVHGAGYLEAPSLYTTIEGSEELLRRLEERGYRISARRLAGGLVASGNASAGAMLTGLDVERDRQVSRLSQEVAEGQWVDDSDPSGVVLGKRLARALDVQVGSELVVLGQAADGSMANDLFTVRGILATVGEATDRAGVFLPRAAFDALYAFDEGAHRMVVRKPEALSAQEAIAEVRGLVEEVSASAEAMSWQELLPTLATMVQSMRGVLVVVVLIIYLAIATLILNAMLMAVFERLKELGVLKAIGMQPRAIFQLMMTEALLQALAAILIAVSLSVPALRYLTRHGVDVGALGGTGVAGMTMQSVWRSEVTVLTYGVPIGVLLFLVVVAVLYPGIKAARISPVEAMRHQ